MVRIRLSRHGGKKDPHYRIVVAEKKNPRDGRFSEIVGYYNPALRPKRLHLDLDRIDHWIKQGAQPSDTVMVLINKVKRGEWNPEGPGDDKSSEPDQAEKEQVEVEDAKAEKPESVDEDKPEESGDDESSEPDQAVKEQVRS